jgi:DNA-directed RNA polymerase subunit K/omega
MSQAGGLRPARDRVLGFGSMEGSEPLTDPTAAAEPEAPPEPRPKAAPIESRFLFVDVAAMRAKQLRRGALPRLDEDDDAEVHRPHPFKPERVAMEEVKRGLVLYDVPAPQQKSV